VTVGVVGIGFGERVLVPAFRASGRCTVAALCASTAERAQRAAQRLGVPKAYGDWRELVADPQITAVAVATPPAVQPAVVKAALAAHKPVFCEKPLAITREAAAELLAVARAARVAQMVDFEFPMLEAWQRAKALLEAGGLGRVRSALVSWQFESYTNRLGLRSWKTRTELGGGVVNLYVSHTLHYVEWLLGPIQSLSARLFPLNEASHDPRGETLAVITLRLGDGTPVSITVNSQALLGTGHRVELYGDEGTLLLHNSTSDYMKGFRLSSGRRTETQLAPIPLPEPAPIEGDSRILPVSRLIERFVTWVEQGIPSRPTIEDGYRVQRLLEATHDSDQTERWVTVAEALPPPPQATAGAPRAVPSPAMAE
jgi:predicted dehydrogenase